MKSRAKDENMTVSKLYLISRKQRTGKNKQTNNFSS